MKKVKGIRLRWLRFSVFTVASSLYLYAFFSFLIMAFGMLIEGDAKG